MANKLLMDLIRNKVEILPVEDVFITDLKAVVAACNPPSKRSVHFKPSSLHCMRIMYFDRIQAPLDSELGNYNGIRICETGSNSHESIQSYVAKMTKYGKDWEWVDVEQYVKDHHLDYLQIRNKKEFETHLLDTRYDISFLCDGIVKHAGKYYILEIKTETDDKGFGRNSADEYHKYQSVSYSLSLGINDILWLYEERNFCTPKSFHTIVTDEDRLKLVQRFECVEQAVKDLVPPARCDSRKTCTYCPYKTECKKFR